MKNNRNDVVLSPNDQADHSYMNNARIVEMRQTLNKYRNGVAFCCLRNSPDNELTDIGICVKYAYELLDALDTHNDSSSPTPPTEMPQLQPEHDDGVRCSAWLGGDPWEQTKTAFLNADGDSLRFEFVGMPNLTLNKEGVQFLVAHLNQWLSCGKICPVSLPPEFAQVNSFLGLKAFAK